MNSDFANNLSFYADAQAFDAYHRYTSYYRQCQQVVAQLLQANPGQLVMEVGCATGETTRLLARHYPQASFVGIDLRPEIIAVAQAQTPEAAFPNLRFAAADMTRLEAYLPFEGRYPDIFYSLYAFHHIPDPLGNKQAYVDGLAELPVDRLRVVVCDILTEFPPDHPGYVEATIAQYDAIAQEAYRSVLINRYSELLSQGLSPSEAYETASLAAAYTREVEITMGRTVAHRQDEYPVTEAQMLELWLDAGFHVEFSSRINALGDSIFVFTRS